MPARKFASKCLGNRRERDATKFVAGASGQNRNDMHCVPNLLHQGPIGLTIVKAALGFVQNHSFFRGHACQTRDARCSRVRTRGIEHINDTGAGGIDSSAPAHG